eukprot:5018199-Amphidinium_carterae.1
MFSLEILGSCSKRSRKPAWTGADGALPVFLHLDGAERQSLYALMHPRKSTYEMATYQQTTHASHQPQGQKQSKN